MTPERQASEALLLARWRLNDPAAWREVLRDEGPHIRYTSWGILRCDADVDEVLFDVLNRAHRAVSQDRFRGQSTLRSYLSAIARNISINRLMHARRRASDRSIPLDAELEHGDTFGEIVPDPAPGVREIVELHELERDIAQKTRGLPREHREMIEDRDAGTTYEAIARQRGILVGTVKSRMARARATLRERLAS